MGKLAIDLDFLIKLFMTLSENKHIPIEILNLPKKQLMSLYKGYLDSDGCIINEKHQFSTTNENMAYSFVSIIHKLFKRPASIYKIKVNPKKEIQGRIVNQKDWYQIRFKLTKNKQDKAFYENDYIWFPFKSLTYLRKDNVYNMEIENDHSYIINGLVSANCQDLSLAGKGKGMADTSTRSGMLWEVERILNELKELNQLPQILLMENVPQVHGSNNVEHFNKWKLALERLGYKNYFQDLIATDYGIPQTRNRCFMISILGDYSYSFPPKKELKLKLKDLLEKEVDEKHYISEDLMKHIQKTKEEHKEYTQYKRYNGEFEQLARVWKEKSPTLHTKSNEIKIYVKNATNHGTITAIQSNDLRIRKLTPRETGRLMGVKDEDINKLLSNQSNASAYHCFGDSIVVNVLMAIFGELLDVNWKEKFKETEEKFIDK